MQFSLLSASLLLLAPLASAEDFAPTQPAKVPAKLGTPTSQGCFKSVKGFEDSKLEVIKVSSGQCREACQEKGKTVFALGATMCYCSNAYPPKADLTDDTACNSGCPAYPLEACGDLDGKAFSVYNTGDKLAVPYYGDDSSTASGSSTKTTASGSSKTVVSTSIITGASSSSSVDVDTATSLATAAGSDSPSTTETAAAATSSVPSSGSKSMMGAGVAILVAALAL